MCTWKRENGEFNEGFSTSQTWDIIREKSPKVTWSKGIWFTGATPKFSFLIWVAIHNRLAIGDRILRWNPQAMTTCWLCKAAFETRDHLFFECDYSKEVWLETIKNLAGCRRIYEWSDVIWAVVNGLHGRILTFLLRYCFQTVAYAVWSEINLRRIRDPSLPASCLIARLDKLIRNRITSLRRRKGGKFEKAMEVWFDRS